MKTLEKIVKNLKQDSHIKLMLDDKPFKTAKTRKTIDKLRISQLSNLADAIFLSSRSVNENNIFFFCRKKTILREFFKHKTTLRDLKKDIFLLKRVLKELANVIPPLLISLCAP